MSGWLEGVKWIMSHVTSVWCHDMGNRHGNSKFGSVIILCHTFLCFLRSFGTFQASFAYFWQHFTGTISFHFKVLRRLLLYYWVRSYLSSVLGYDFAHIYSCFCFCSNLFCVPWNGIEEILEQLNVVIIIAFSFLLRGPMGPEDSSLTIAKDIELLRT